jgi:O-antigen ligase
LFLFLTVALFFVYHDLANARSEAGNYDAAADVYAGVVAEGSVARRVAVLALAAFALYSLIRYRADDRLRLHGPLGVALAGFVGWAIVSPLWADDRSLTLTRAAVFAILFLASLAVVRRFSLREIILWTFFASGAYLAFGLFAELLFGTFRPLASGYRFAGTLHPNNQGVNCALLLLSGLAAADLKTTDRRQRRIYRAGALLGFLFLLLTASRTAFAASLLALAVYGGMVYSRRVKLAMIYACAILFCLLVLSLGNAFLPDVKSAAMLGRDSSNMDSFNGRTGVWTEIARYIAKRPIVGYGYGGFWTPAHITEISEGEQWGIPNSHSAYLDYLLALGAVGMLAYAVVLCAGVSRAFRYYRLFHHPGFVFCAAFLLFCAFDGFLESTMMDPSLHMFLTWVVLCALAFRGVPNLQRDYHFSSARPAAAIS